MKNVKIKYINDYIDYFTSTILNLKSQKEQIEKIYRILTKYQKKMQSIFLVMEEVPL